MLCNYLHTSVHFCADFDLEFVDFDLDFVDFDLEFVDFDLDVVDPDLDLVDFDLDLVPLTDVESNCLSNLRQHLTPSPIYPWLQMHKKLPSVLQQLALWWQLSIPSLHSLIS